MLSLRDLQFADAQKIVAEVQTQIEQAVAVNPGDTTLAEALRPVRELAQALANVQVRLARVVAQLREHRCDRELVRHGDARIPGALRAAHAHVGVRDQPGRIQPLDWDDFSGWTIVGWIVMAFLLSFGAPFWQDALESLFGLKNFLRQKTDTRKVEQESGAGLAHT